MLPSGPTSKEMTSPFATLSPVTATTALRNASMPLLLRPDSASLGVKACERNIFQNMCQVFRSKCGSFKRSLSCSSRIICFGKMRTQRLHRYTSLRLMTSSTLYNLVLRCIPVQRTSSRASIKTLASTARAILIWIALRPLLFKMLSNNLHPGASHSCAFSEKRPTCQN